MKKYLLVVVLLIASLHSAIAQTVSTAVVEYNGLKYPAYVKEMEVGTDQVEAAVKEYFASKGAKERSHKGYTTYRNVRLAKGGTNELQDAFVRVERAGKRNEDKSRLIVILTKPGAISEDKPSKAQKEVGSGVVLVAGGSVIFDELNPGISNQLYLFEIGKLEKELKELESDMDKLERSREKLEKELENTRNDIGGKQEEVAKIKAMLEVKRKAGPVM
jgi:exonuclease VII small subunit